MANLLSTTITGSITIPNESNDNRLYKGGNWVNPKDPWGNFHIQGGNSGEMYIDSAAYHIRNNTGGTEWLYINSSRLDVYVSQYTKYLRINQNWASGDYGAEQFTIRGTYPSIALRSTQHNSKWLIHHASALQFYYGGAVDDNSWANKFEIPTDGNIWMAWANDYISNLLGAKQNASTAITTSNIGSQSVNYASSAGNSSQLEGFSAYSLVTEARGAHSGSDFTRGTLVTTDINADGWAGDSFIMEVSGKSYGSGTPFKLIMEGYLYADTIINVSAMSYGSYFPSPVKVMRYNGNVAFWWPRGSYWNSFEVHVRNANGDSWNRVTGITDANDPAEADKKISITPTQVIHTGNIGSQSVSYATTAGSANSVAWSNVSSKPSTFPPDSHNHDDRYYTEAEVNSITHQWEWRWIRRQGYVAPAGGSAEQWTNYYLSYFTERTNNTEINYPEQESGYINTITNVGSDGGFGGSQYGNIFGDLESYHCLIYTNIFVEKEFRVSVSNFNGDDPHAIFIDGVFVHGNTGCCVDTSYTYTFKPGWHRIDLIYSEGGGGDFIRMGWNPSGYTSIIKDMTPHRAGENPRNILDKFKNLVIQSDQSVRAPIFYDSQDTGFYLDPNSNSRLVNLGLGGATPDLRLSVSGDIHMDGYIYQGGTAGVVNSWGSRTYVNSGNYVSNARSFRFDNVGYGSTWALDINSSGNVIASVDMRAPIFYDSNNTDYYGDFASLSRVNEIGANKMRADTNGDYTTDRGWWSHDPYGYGWGKPYGSFRTLEVSSSGDFSNEPAMFRIHQWGSGAAEFWKPKGTILYLRETPGGSSTWFTKFEVQGSQNITGYLNVNGATEHTINDNSRVVGSSTNNTVFINGSIQLTSNNDAIVIGRGTATFLSDEELGFGWGGGWYMTESSYIRSRGSKSLHMNGGSVDYVGSLYLEGSVGVHLQPNAGSYGSLQVSGSKDGWHGVRFTGSNVVVMANTNEVGFHNNAAGWQFLWSAGTAYVYKGGTGGGTQATVWDSVNAPRANFDNLMYYQGFTLDANTMATNSTGFTYAVNAPFYGPIARFSTGGGYDLWIGGSYGGGGNAFYLRTRNGDNGTFNAWREIITSGNIASQSVSYADESGYSASSGSVEWTSVQNKPATFTPSSHTHDDRYLVKGGGWYGVGLPGSRWGGFSVSGGEIVFGDGLPNAGQMGILIDGAYLAGENNGFWSLASDNSWGSRRGMYWDGSNLNFATNSPTALFNSIRLSTSTNNGTISGGGDWGIRFANDNGWIQFGPANNSWTHIYTDKNFYFNQNLYVNGALVALNSSSPTFQEVYANGWFRTTGYQGLYNPTNNAHFYPNSASYGSWRIDGTRNGWHGLHFDSGSTLMMNSTETGIHREGYGWQFRWYNGSMFVSRGTYGGGTEYTVIDSGTIGSQSVNYATSAGSASSSSRSSALDIVGYGNGNMTYYQSPGTFAGYSGWAGYFVSNHGDGATYYNQTIIMPFWGAPQYSRLQGGTFVGPYTFWTTENLNDYAPNMNQYVRTTDNVTFRKVYVSSDAGDNTGGYRLKNTSGTETLAMWVQSGNALVVGNSGFARVSSPIAVRINASLAVNVAESGVAGRIDAGNDIVAYSTSDERFKENITPIPNALDKVKTLTGVEFDWRKETKDYHGYVGHDVGVIAQQVKAVLPEAVRTNANGYLAVRYEKLIGLLIEGMKEQQAQIDELKAKLDGLTK